MIYAGLKKILFLRNPEAVHDSVLRMLSILQDTPAGAALLHLMAGRVHPQPVKAMGLHFQHPLGVAAGFDKDARCVLALQDLGFAFVEVGTVTPRPQSGNPQPRLWRFPEAHALVNSLGFPGEGMHAVGERLSALRESARLQIPVGVNIGKNKDTTAENASADYSAVLDFLHPFADFFVVNVSSPNTPGLRDLQSVEKLRPILSTLQDRNHIHGVKPLLIKIAPDLADEDIYAIGRLVNELRLGGIVAGNTTIRREIVPRTKGIDRGGLSGAPQFPRTVDMLRILRSELSTKQTLISVGGISSPDRLSRVLSLGANLAEIYTPFIYLGPRSVKKLLSET